MNATDVVARHRAAWMLQAACQGTDPNLFFPIRGEDERAAKALCGLCPVRWECLEHALTVPEHQGIWGGTSGRQRHELRRRRGLVEAVS